MVAEVDFGAAEQDLAAQIARLDESIKGARDDIKDVKESATDGLKIVDSRLRMLEDVRVRAIEDWMLLERERTRERQQQAKEKGSRMSRRDALLGTALICVVTLLSALIASGHIF